MASIANADPKTADDRKPKRRYHYISFTMDADPEALAEECNLRAGRGYRLHTAHFFGTANPQATLIFERRLRPNRPKKTAAAAVEVPEAPPPAERS